jgi:hypothetical protein
MYVEDWGYRCTASECGFVFSSDLPDGRRLHDLRCCNGPHLGVSVLGSEGTKEFISRLDCVLQVLASPPTEQDFPDSITQESIIAWRKALALAICEKFSGIVNSNFLTNRPDKTGCEKYDQN